MWVSNKIIILEIQYKAPNTYNIVNFPSPFKIKICGHWDCGTSFQPLIDWSFLNLSFNILFIK